MTLLNENNVQVAISITLTSGKITTDSIKPSKATVHECDTP